MGGMQNFLRFIAGSGKVVFVDSISILTFLREVSLGAQPTLTTSEKYFEDAGVMWMGRNFQELFIGLEVPSVSSADLVVRELEKDSLDAPIISELGGEGKAETYVSHFVDFLSKNKESLMRFIFYLRGKDGNIWAVDAYWYADVGGWNVDAYSVSFPGGWFAGRRVVSSK